MAQAQQNNVITEEELNELSKKWYGLSNKDIEELSVFINEFDDACKDLPEVATYDDLKAVVDSGNKIPSHCGHMIFSYFVNRHGDDKLINMIISMYNVYTELFAEDPESTKTTDIYETLSCCVLFAPHKTLRKFVQKYFDTAEKLLKIIRKRPSSAGCLLARYSELYTTSKHDAKYAKSIISTFNDMIAFLQEKNDITPEDIRGVSYDIAHQAIANKYGITKDQARLLIGKLDLVIHETENGVVEIVPNNVHRFNQIYATNENSTSFRDNLLVAVLNR